MKSDPFPNELKQSAQLWVQGEWAERNLKVVSQAFLKVGVTCRLTGLTGRQ